MFTGLRVLRAQEYCDKGSLLVCKLLLGSMGHVYRASGVEGTRLMLEYCDKGSLLVSKVRLGGVGDACRA